MSIEIIKEGAGDLMQERMSEMSDVMDAIESKMDILSDAWDYCCPERRGIRFNGAYLAYEGGVLTYDHGN